MGRFDRWVRVSGLVENFLDRDLMWFNKNKNHGWEENTNDNLILVNSSKWNCCHFLHVIGCKIKFHYYYNYLSPDYFGFNRAIYILQQIIPRDDTSSRAW